jgi:hypothetical protein
MGYLSHHPHLPKMYPSKPYKSSGKSLQTDWHTGFAEYLPGDYGDGLMGSPHLLMLILQDVFVPIVPSLLIFIS